MMTEISGSSSKGENINDESMSIIRECDDQQQVPETLQLSNYLFHNSYL